MMDAQTASGAALYFALGLFGTPRANAIIGSFQAQGETEYTKCRDFYAIAIVILWRPGKSLFVRGM